MTTEDRARRALQTLARIYAAHGSTPEMVEALSKEIAEAEAAARLAAQLHETAVLHPAEHR